MKTSILLVLLPLLSVALALPTPMPDGVSASSNLDSHVATTSDTHYSNKKRTIEGETSSTPSNDASQTPPTNEGLKATEPKKDDPNSLSNSASTTATTSKAGEAPKNAIKSSCLKIDVGKTLDTKFRVFFYIHGEDHQEKTKALEAKLPATAKDLFKFKVNKSKEGVESSSARATKPVDKQVADELFKIFETEFKTRSTKIF